MQLAFGSCWVYLEDLQVKKNLVVLEIIYKVLGVA
jgi:hypothetical protein